MRLRYDLVANAMNNIKTIKKALTRYKQIASLLRYGGLEEDYRLAVKALEALELIKQPRLELLLVEDD